MLALVSNNRYNIIINNATPIEKVNIMTNSTDSRYDEFALFENEQDASPNEITIKPAKSETAVICLPAATDLPTIDTLRDFGTMIDVNNENDASLYEYQGAQYSVDYDNTVTAGADDFNYFAGDSDTYPVDTTAVVDSPVDFEILPYNNQSIETIVEEINLGAVFGFENHTSEMLAANYAAESFDDDEVSDDDFEAEIETNLDYLEKNGAIFDRYEAWRLASSARDGNKNV